MNVCAVCKTIPFSSLPSEDEPAFPHHETLEDLYQSAAKCNLCNLIIGAAGELCRINRNIQEGKATQNPGGWISHSSGGVLPSGEHIMYRSVEGNWSTNGMMAGGDYNGPLYLDPCEMFPAGSKVRPWLFGNWWRVEGKFGDQLIGLGVRLGETGILNEAVGNTEEVINFWGSNLRIRTDNNAPLSTTIPGRIRSLHSESLIGMMRAKNWLDKCDQNHRCAPQNQKLPTRVLLIDESDSAEKVSLLSSAGLEGRYVALSHSWGLSHRIVTTKASLADHQKGIAIADLPKTFQDAVSVTRLLNLKYLWIDSLCIIQDDAQDWEKEAALMGDVYANSYLTIAASSSTDDSSGCFTSSNDRCAVSHVCSDNRSLARPVARNASPLIYLTPGNPAPAYLCQQTMAYLDYVSFSFGPIKKSRLYISEEWMPTSLKSKPKIYQIGQFGGTFDPVSSEPLAKRAWTLQERVLAPRTLHYGKEQMYWECLEGMLPEDGALFPRVFPSMRTLLGLEKADITKDMFMLDLNGKHPDKLPKPEPMFSNKWNEEWLKLIEKYTRRALTREEDKFPALSGLAGSIASYTKDIYHAGIWSSDLMSGLHWKVHAFEPIHWCDDPAHDHKIAQLTPAAKSKVRIPDKWRAPSWSWASLDAEIDFVHLGKHVIAERVECVTTAEGGDEYGRLKKGSYVKIRAPLIELHDEPCRHVPGTANATPFTKHVSIILKTQDTSSKSEGAAHFDQEVQFPCSAVFLDLTHALIVVSDGEHWSRVGIVSFTGLDSTVGDLQMTRNEMVEWRFGEGVDQIIVIK